MFLLSLANAFALGLSADEARHQISLLSFAPGTCLAVCINFVRACLERRLYTVLNEPFPAVLCCDDVCCSVSVVIGFNVGVIR